MRPEPVVSYQSGKWMAVAGPDMWMLVDCRPEDSLVRSIWSCLRANGGLPEVERVLSDPTVKTAASFAAVAVRSGAVTVAVGGETEVLVSTTDGSRRLACPEGVAFARYRLCEVPTSVRISDGLAEPSAFFPIESGVAPAGVLDLNWNPASETAVPPEPVTVEERAALVEDPPFPSVTSPQVILESDAVDTNATLTSFPVADANAEPQAAAAPEETYSFLFGNTVNRSVEEAAVRAEVTEEPESPLTQAVPVVSAPPPPVTPVASPPQPVIPPQLPAGDGMIDSVPWAPPADSSRRNGPAPSEVDEVELTVNRATHAALLGRVDGPASLATSAPMVHAVRCFSGHPNPPHAERCRICHGDIADESPITLPRPALGRLRLSTGAQVTLDRGVLMGRGPSEGRHVAGERPHLVKLPSPEHDISRNHLEVRIDGWHVLVTDLNSTNGTMVARPGMPPERLRPDQPTMIEPGTVVTLSDEVSFTYEATT